MPHVIVKMASGRTEEQKQKIANEILKVLIKFAQVDEESVSIKIEDIDMNNWKYKVYDQDVLPYLDTLHKKPGYKP